MVPNIELVYVRCVNMACCKATSPFNVFGRVSREWLRANRLYSKWSESWEKINLLLVFFHGSDPIPLQAACDAHFLFAVPGDRNPRALSRWLTVIACWAFNHIGSQVTVNFWGSRKPIEALMHERPVKAEKDENCTHPATAPPQQDQLFLQMIDVIC